MSAERIYFSLFTGIRYYQEKFRIIILSILWPGEMWLYKQEQNWKFRSQFTPRVQGHGGKFCSEVDLLLDIQDDVFLSSIGIPLNIIFPPSCSGSCSQLWGPIV